MSEILSLGEWVRRRRKALDLTQDELAVAVGCSKELIAKIEQDARRPSKQVAELLAQALCLAPEEVGLFVRAARAELAADQLVDPLASLPRPTLVAGIPTPVGTTVPSPSAADGLPSGTVTFLFTDIEGSTRLWNAHPQAMRQALAHHNLLLRTAIERHGGHVFKTIGDAFCAAFASAVDGLAAAIDAQRALLTADWHVLGLPIGQSIRVRMALHTGVVEAQEGDYLGPPLNHVARLLAAGHAGQVLLSGVVYELVRDILPAGCAVRALGSHRLRDLPWPERIYQVVAPDLPTDFPALQSLEPPLGNLPIHPNALIGREAERTEIAAFLRDTVRLITLTGPGGTGKTRLALQVGADMRETFPDGVWFVDLSPVSDGSLVASMITQVLGLREVPGQPLRSTLLTWLHGRRLLLVIDNCEQVVDTSADLCAEMMRSAPEVQLLATSRIALRLRGEQEYPVAPLSLPDIKQLPPIEQLSQYDAVTLFIRSAQAIRPDFQITNINAPVVAEICVRLDGLPLAIELAAARMRLFSPEQLLSRLVSASMQLLTGGARDLPTRQQTIRATIAWSYALLSPANQRLFIRFGVFVGGWTLEAAEAICSDAQFDLPSGLEQLVEHSLIRLTYVDEFPRYTMLETIREYAIELLHTQGMEHTLREQHAKWFAIWAIESVTRLWGATQIRELAGLRRDYDNLRAALTWLQAYDMPSAEHLVVKLSWYWYWTIYRREGITAVKLALSQHHSSDGVRADLLRIRALLTYDGDPDPAREWMAESLALARAGADDRQIAETLLIFAQIELSIGRDDNDGQQYLDECRHFFERLHDRLGIARYLLLEDSTEAWERSLTIFQEVGHIRGTADVQARLGRHWHLQKDDDRAWDLLGEAIHTFRQLGDTGGEIWALLGYGDVAQSLGRLDDAMRVYEQARDMAYHIGDLNAEAWACMNLGEAFACQEQSDVAVQYICNAIRYFHTTQYDYGREIGLLGAAYIAWSLGRFQRAAEFLAILEYYYRQHLGVPFEDDAPGEHLRFYQFIYGKLKRAFNGQLPEYSFSTQPTVAFAEGCIQVQRLAEETIR